MGQGILESNKRWFNQTSCIDKSYLAHYPGQAPPHQQKIHPEKNSLYFGKWNFLTLILKKFLYFLKGTLFLYFLKINIFLYFQKQNPVLSKPKKKQKKS